MTVANRGRPDVARFLLRPMNATNASVLLAADPLPGPRPRFAFSECVLSLVAVSVWCVLLPLELVWRSL
jgi:hypothetical protein